MGRRRLALVSSAFQKQPASTRFPRPIKIHPQRTDNGVLRGHNPPRASMVLGPCEAVWCSSPAPLVRNTSASLVNSPHRHLYDDATCMLAALLAYFPEDASSFVTVCLFTILASRPICQEPLDKHVVAAPRRWPWFQLPAFRLQNSKQAATVCPVKADK